MPPMKYYSWVPKLPPTAPVARASIRNCENQKSFGKDV
jgi:hypothetical protein